METVTSAHAHILDYIPQCGFSYQGQRQSGHMSTFQTDIVDVEIWAEEVIDVEVMDRIHVSGTADPNKRT